MNCIQLVMTIMPTSSNFGFGILIKQLLCAHVTWFLSVND